MALVLVLVESSGQVPARSVWGSGPLEPGKVPQMAAAERARASPDESCVELAVVVLVVLVVLERGQIPGKISSLRSA